MKYFLCLLILCPVNIFACQQCVKNIESMITYLDGELENDFDEGFYMGLCAALALVKSSHGEAKKPCFEMVILKHRSHYLKKIKESKLSRNSRLAYCPNLPMLKIGQSYLIHSL